uniref:Uncharacterized protein n=1 Tax=Arundo donax TaxID=35708 RepID=A0A0A9ADM9_ARUDO
MLLKVFMVLEGKWPNGQNKSSVYE